MKPKAKGWPGEPARHGLSAKGVKTADTWQSKPAGRYLRDDVFFAVDDLQSDDPKLVRIIRETDWDKATYGQLVDALERGLEVLGPEENEDPLLNALHTLDKESKRYAK